MSARICVCATRISGSLDIEILRRSIEALIHRHEALRTRFVVVDGSRYQHVDTATEFRLRVIDLSDPLSRARGSRVNSLVQEFMDEKIDLVLGPLFDARIFKESDEEHVLVVMVDHMVSDGASNAILVRELWTLYEQAIHGQSFSLPPLAVQFPDYSVWRYHAEHAWMREHSNYWLAHLSGASRLVIPSDPGMSAASSGANLTVHIPFGAELSRRLETAAHEQQMPLALLVLTAYVFVLSCWFRQQDLLMPVLSHGRHGHPELRGVVGFISHTLHLRILIDHAQTFRDLLNEIQSEFGMAIQYQDFDQVSDLVPELQTELPGLNFHWRPKDWSRDGHSHLRNSMIPIKLRPFMIRLTDWPWKFWPVFYHIPAGIGVTISYKPECLAERTIRQFSEKLRWAAHTIVDRPFERLDCKSGAWHQMDVA